MERGKRRAGILFSIPTLIILFIVIIVPLLWLFIISLSDYTFISPTLNNFVGIKNFITVIKSGHFWNSIIQTLKFVILVVTLEFSLGFFIAMLLNQDIRFKAFYY